ncbi:Hypothetical protein R9X50_00727700 [Acrodontium crateriforme]|uniref:Transmembrane protein n=1 Tax=Acrodontium crateriforme TaxID=150365 RepID=A0AAQ3R7H8_9PEZI|nr:Hypothetical protein R9X50_00727700 [Acrodontium crateriforme]
MHSFQHLLQSIFVVLACASDWFLAFDFWIVTPPQWPRVEYFPRSVIVRKRMMTTLRTALFYALVEPLLYVALVHMTANASFPLLFLSFVAITTASLCVKMVMSGLEHVKTQHEQLCGDSFQDAPQSSGETASSTDEVNSSDASNEDDYKEVDNLLIEYGTDASEESPKGTAHRSFPPDPNPTPSANEQLSSSKRFVPGPHCPHEYTLAWKLAPFVPTLLSSAVNAALLYYVRSLNSAFSLEWIDRFAFGWTAIALLSLFAFFCGKWANNMVVMVLFRHPLQFGDRKNWTNEFLLRSSSFFVFIVLRAAQRFVLGLHPVAIPFVNTNGTALILASDVSFGNFTTTSKGEEASEDSHVFDRFLTGLPGWTRWVFPMVNIVIGIFFFAHSREQQKKRSS